MQQYNRTFKHDVQGSTDMPGWKLININEGSEGIAFGGQVWLGGNQKCHG